MRTYKLAGLLVALVTAHQPLVSRAQTAHLAEGCVLENKQLYHCGAEPFRSRLVGAQTVAIEADSLDRYTQRELRHLVERLGKRVAQAGETPDLTFVVAPAGQGPVSIGPADRPLVSLDIYARSVQPGRGTLVWQETFSGQGDRPWQLIVRGVIDQFESHARSEVRAVAK